MIYLKTKGSFKKSNSFFEKLLEVVNKGTLNKYGELGVEALRAATPIDSGKTANSWTYEITRENGHAKISWINTNVNEYVNIAIILQYGHATGNGGYVQGRDYINPALRPVFDKIAEDAWKEITKL